MPIQYRGITEEHQAVRNACGVFDVSHMGEVLVSGAEAEKFVNHIFTNDVTGAENGKIFYGMMTRPNGGTVDDLLVYKISDLQYLLVINASNIDKDLEWILANTEGYDVKVENLSDETGELAIQGPDSERVLESLGISCASLTFYTFHVTEWQGERVLVSRTGYTGEDGFEVYASHHITRALWAALLATGDVEPCGLGCRDTLRFEVGLPLYGDELSEEITPLEASLGIFVKLEKPEFIGREALAEQKEQGPARKLVGLEILDRAIARHGAEVLDGEGNKIGEVTTGYRGISVDKSLAMALVDAKYAVRDTPLQVKVRRKVFPVVVIPRKFYKKSYKK